MLVFYIILFDFEGNFDALTKLYNRSAFEKEIIKLENKTNYSIVLLDINKFKLVNDTFGHDYGDLVLMMAERNKGHLQSINEVFPHWW